MRVFDSGATRDADLDKLDFEGFLSPLALERFAGYMHSHRKQADGNLRDSDNWQKGIPLDAYMKSMWRHFFDLWKMHRGLAAIADGELIDKQEALCAILFNAMGYLHELERGAYMSRAHDYEARMSLQLPDVQGGDDLTESPGERGGGS